MTDINSTDRVTSLDGSEKIPILQGGTFKHFRPYDLGGLRLTADATVYVATTGNDVTGTGASGAPFASLNRAYEWIAANIDFAGFVVYISIADGTYDALRVYANAAFGGIVCLIGNVASPSNVIIQGQLGRGNYSCLAFEAAMPTTTYVVGVTLHNNTAGEYDSIYINGPHKVVLGSSPDGQFASTLFTGEAYGIASIFEDANLSLAGNLDLDAGLAYVLFCDNSKATVGGIDATSMASLAISDSFLYVVNLSYVRALIGENIQTTVTGKKYICEGLSLIDDVVNGIPGSIAGTTAAGGIVR